MVSPLALPKCVHLTYLRRISLMTKIYGFIDSCSPVNKFYSFIIFGLLINTLIWLLNGLVLIL